MLKILIADDQQNIRSRLKQIVAEERDMVVTGEAVDGIEALDKALNEDFDFLLLDVTMPGLNGIEVLRQVKVKKPDLPVLIVSVHPADEYAERAIKEGASGYLTKDNALDQLVNAIRVIVSGGTYK